jgi:hypothetical protein
MKHQGIVSETLRLLRQVYVINSDRGLAAEQGLAIGALSMQPLGEHQIKSAEQLHLLSRRKNISWFLGLYVTSLLSMSGLIGGVRWVLAFL